MAALTPGHSLGHRFTLVRPLGEGGMGVVWLVEDHELEERVVIKLLPADAPPEWVTLLKRECRNARRLIHPNIVRVYDLHHEDPHHFISMAFVEGENIGQLRGRPLPKILASVLPVADALDYAHRQGVIHRDLKSTNVLLDASGEPQLVDFGIAGLLKASEDTELPVWEHEPTVSDDVYAFGALLYELLGDRTEPLPENLASLLTALLSTHPADPAHMMGAVKDALQDAQRDVDAQPQQSGKARPSRESKTPVILAPPPRVARGDTIRPRMPGPPTPPTAETPASSVGWLTIGTIALLIGAAASVFILLPRWAPKLNPASPGAADTQDTGAPPRSEDATTTEEASLRDQAALKTQAEGLREEALALRDALEQKNVSSWGGAQHRSSSEAIEAGDQKLRERAYQAATDTYQVALADLRELANQADVVLRKALGDGRQALDAGNSPAAIAAFELAASIDPGNREAATGLSRASMLNEVIRLLAEGADYERRGELPSARESYRKALSLDGQSQKARLALARAEGNLTEVAFQTAMSNGLEALNRQDYQKARQFFLEARTIKPGDSQVANAAAQADEGIRLETIAERQEKARHFESEEQWHQAAEEYDAVLELDPTIRFAQEGKARSDAVAALADAIAYHLDHPDRLSDEQVLAAASGIVEEADRIQPTGPKLAAQRVRLARLVSQASTPVPVLLESDNRTEVVVYKIGRLGRFERHTLELRPGTYTVVGTRPGYRDVRATMRIEAGQEPKPLIVRCEEEI